MHADVAGGGTKFNIRLLHTGMERADRRAVVCSSGRVQLNTLTIKQFLFRYKNIVCSPVIDVDLQFVGFFSPKL